MREIPKKKHRFFWSSKFLDFVFVVFTPMKQELLEFRGTFVNSSSIIVFIPLGIQNTFTSGEVCSHLGRYQRHGRTDRQRWTLWKCKNCLFNQYPTLPEEYGELRLLTTLQELEIVTRHFLRDYE